ncbi:related to AUR1 - inositol phosphorylceramide synthase [Melanopsichium pennsylvanicum]|uniref:Related to AUR1 - inositol phosphorylceramide synthase n=2 Tax=Melanopsichium pennsylvanicum TaxID=63383 RepID=A0AAJ4XJH9_9BASI|nr:related to AUR1-inositol phosphorylceramide synthase [Melanopsichium pennsylvanicum 4]SNX83283.1 related to AUR1 - inositol phosphorylceramide synthase [Melanopsichium pennsylvanicum]
MTASSRPRLAPGAPGTYPNGVVFQLPPKARLYLPSWLHYLLSRILAAASRLSFSTSVKENLDRLRSWSPSKGERFKYAFLLSIALFSLFVMETPAFPYKLIIPALYTTTLLFPVTSQFFLPAAPIFAWLILFYSCKFIPAAYRPHIWVSVLPTLETIWYGANISDILTQFGHPVLDILAWLPYGVIHFAAPFFVASFLFVFAPPGSVKVFAQAFGFMMLVGVMIQILFPCAPPWYELREGLTPANYGMRGSPAGLARIDALFHSHGYTLTFTGAPMVFGAFPSLHAGNATIKALFCSYFFPVVLKIGRLRLDARVLYWTYCSILYWSTMYLMHHYLIDLVAGACLATFSFYFFLTDEIREAMEQHYPYRNSAGAPPSAAPPSNRPDLAFASTAAAATTTTITASGESSIALDTLRSNGGGGAPYITAQGGVNGDVESQKRPEVIFSIDDSSADSGDIAGSTAEEDRRKENAAALLARTKSPVQRVRSPAVNGKNKNQNSEG